MEGVAGREGVAEREGVVVMGAVMGVVVDWVGAKVGEEGLSLAPDSLLE